ncbi:hypothetical protein N7488_002574 [Penicillium malachiteum]|nr:hypothetical protein N7488_002574 [Penicillium malachiteum]
MLGEACLEWDEPGGLVTSTAWREPQVSGAFSRQRSVSEASPSHQVRTSYGYQTSLETAQLHAGHQNRNSWQRTQHDLSPRLEYSNEWFATSPRGLHEIVHKHKRGSFDKKGHDHIGSSVAATARGSISPISPDFRTFLAYSDDLNSPLSRRRPTRASISDHSDASGASSSNSDETAIIPSSLRLHGLGLLESVHSPLITPPGNCVGNVRWDPQAALGQVPQDVDALESPEATFVVPGGGNEHDTLDPRYKRQSDPRRFFRVGRVFMMLRHENAGYHGTTMSQKDPSLGREYTKVRMADKLSPVTTYSGQGVAKAGVDHSKHTIIYMRGSQPVTRQNEPKMIKEPLEVEPARADQKLDLMSRLNFGKVYTVEHNVKVLPVGQITKDSLQNFNVYTRAEFSK